jgi:hypothetical protein
LQKNRTLTKNKLSRGHNKFHSQFASLSKTQHLSHNPFRFDQPSIPIHPILITTTDVFRLFPTNNLKKMVNENPENLEASLSSLNAGDDLLAPGAGGTNTSTGQERLWHSMSVIDSCSSRPQEMLPLRPGPGSRSHRSGHHDDGAAAHKQRGHLRPDGWVGTKSTKRSWRVKSISDVSGMMMIGDKSSNSVSGSKDHDDDDDDTASTEPPRSVRTFHVDMLPSCRRSGGVNTTSTGMEKTTNDGKAKESSNIPAVVLPVVVASNIHCDDKEEKNHATLTFDGNSSMHSVLTEDSRSRVAGAREMWNSLNSLDYHHHPIKDHAEMSTVELSESHAGHREVSKKKEDHNSIIPRNSSRSTTVQSLPELEMSLTSLDLSFESSEYHESETGKMWKSMGAIERFMRPDEMLPLRPPSGVKKRNNGDRKSAPTTIQHNFRAFNRPDDWLGPRAKSKKSWKVKQIVESDLETTVENTGARCAGD